MVGAGWHSISGVEKIISDTPAPKGKDRGAKTVFDKGADVRKANIAALVAKLRKEPTKH